MIIYLIIGVFYSAEVNLIPIKHIFSGTMKAVLVIICLIIGVSYSAEVCTVLHAYHIGSPRENICLLSYRD